MDKGMVLIIYLTVIATLITVPALLVEATEHVPAVRKLADRILEKVLL